MRLLAFALAFAALALPASAQVTQPPPTSSGGSSTTTVVCQTGAASTDITGGTSETTFSNGSCTIPAGTVGANSIVLIDAFSTATSSANTKTLRIKVGASTIATVTNTTGAWWRVRKYLYSTNATNAQTASSSAINDDANTSNSSAAQTFSLDFTSSQSVTITGQLATGSENFVLRFLRVSVLNPAS